MLSLTLCNPMDCNPPGSSIHGAFQARNAGAGCCCLLQGVFPTLGPNLRLLHWQADSYTTEPLGNPRDFPIFICAASNRPDYTEHKATSTRKKQNRIVTTATEECLVIRELHLMTQTIINIYISMYLHYYSIYIIIF